MTSGRESLAAGPLRQLLEEALPPPVSRDVFEQWCGKRFEAGEVLRAVGAELIEVEDETFVVSYSPKPPPETRAVALLYALGPMSMPEIRTQYRELYPKSAFSEASLRVALVLDERIQALPNGRFVYKPEDRQPSVNAESKQAPGDEQTPSDAGDIFDSGIGRIPLAAIAIPGRALRLLTLNGIETVGGVLNSPELLDDLGPRDRKLTERVIASLVAPAQPTHHRLLGLSQDVPEPPDPQLEDVRQEKGDSEDLEEASSPRRQQLVLDLDSDETENSAIPVGNQYIYLDGTVDQERLAEAVDGLAEGGLLELGHANIVLEQPLLIGKSLFIIGVDAEKSVITYVGKESCAVVQLDGEHVWTLRDLSIVVDISDSDPDTLEWADCLEISDGRAWVERCKFSGAMSSGLDVRGCANVTLTNCECSRNNYGLSAGDDSLLVVDACELHSNGDDGIFVHGRSHCTVIDSDLWDNGGCGIFVDERATCTIRENLCRNNGASGVLFRANASGRVTENKLLENRTGINLHGDALVWLERNQCQANNDGIIWNERARGKAQDNTCEANRSCGIYVGAEATPLIEENTCVENQLKNVFVVQGSPATLRENRQSRLPLL